MDFFNELGSKLTATGKKAKAKASNLVDTAKVSNQLNDLSREIRGLYTQLGELYYQQHSGDAESPMDEVCAQIRAREENVEQAKLELQRLRKVKVCPQCGNENPPDAHFCSKCSAALPEIAQPEPQGRVCPQCGAAVAPDALFCDSCGTRLE